MIGDVLRQLRTDRNLTLEEVGQALGMTHQLVYKYEKNIIANPTLKRIQTFSKFYDVSPAYLLGYTDIPRAMSVYHQRLTENADKLNHTGQSKLLEYSEELAEHPSYKR